MPKVIWDIDANTKPLESKLNKLDRKAEKTGDKFSALGGLGKGIGLAAVATGAGVAVAGIAKLGGELETTRLQFQTMLGSVEKGNKMLGDLAEFANFTPFTNDQINKAGKTLLSFGFEADEIMPTLKILGDVSAGTGKDLGELGVIFGQIRGAGRLMGQDLLQLINAGFNPLQVMSKRTGKSMGQLKDDMSKGLISFKDVEQAFKDATSEGGLFNNMTKKLSNSFQGKLSTALGKGRFLLQKIGEKQIPLFNSGLDAAISLIDAVAGEEEKRSSVMRREIAVSDGLFNALKRSNLEADERKRLFDEVNKRYGEYLPNLLTEKSSIDEVRKAQNKLTQSLERQLKVQLKQESQRELLERKARAVKGLTKIQLQEAGLEALRDTKGAEARREITKSFELPEEVTRREARFVKRLRGNRRFLEKELEEVEKSLLRSEEAFDKAFGDLGNQTTVTEDETEETTTASQVKTNGTSGGQDIKNFNIRIEKLNEMNVENVGDLTDAELQDKMTRVLVGAVNNFQRLAGG